MMTKVEITTEQRHAILEHLRAWEDAYLNDPVHGITNPFRRRGVTAREIANLLGFFKEGHTKSGAARYDTPRARRLLKQLIACGEIVSVGTSRTLQAGSKGLECFTLPGFDVRYKERCEAITMKWEES